MTDAAVNVPMGVMVSSGAADGCMMSPSMEPDFAPCGLPSPGLADGVQRSHPFHHNYSIEINRRSSFALNEKNVYI